MRIWDIVDEIYPEVEFVGTQQGAPRWSGIISSAVNCAFAVGLVVASSGTFAANRQGYVSDHRAKIQVATLTERATELGQVERVLRELRPDEGVQQPSTRDLRDNYRRYDVPG